ncbi:MAG: hypothetical protein QM737_09915 [Ferruginibacter sp.]
MSLDELIMRLGRSISEFCKKKCSLLQEDVHEDNLSVELRDYLKQEFNDWPYSISFNHDKRVLNNAYVKKHTYFFRDELPKSIRDRYADIEDPLVMKEILPDIIFHDENSSKHNFLIIEIKKTTNKDFESRLMDRLKLEAATSCDLNYEFGAFLDFKTGKDYEANNPYLVKLFINGVSVFTNYGENGN